MTEDAPVESDRVPGAPHPRETATLVGQDAAVAQFHAAATSGRLHHGWLITGPRGTGKATLAWRIARWLLAGAGSPDLSVPPDHPIARRLLALSEPRLHLVRRSLDDKGRLRGEIVVDDMRRLLSFFQLSAVEGGRRVAIIDAADDMNPNAANALLKLLEEPPRDALLLLVAHRPARLLPTIRSRCRELRLAPLSPGDMARALAPLEVQGDAARLAALSGGSVGEALRLAGQDGLDRYAQLVALFSRHPDMDRHAAAAFAQGAAGRPGAEGDPFDLTMTLIELFLARAARSGLLGPPLPEAAPQESATLPHVPGRPRRAALGLRAGRAVGARPRGAGGQS